MTDARGRAGAGGTAAAAGAGAAGLTDARGRAGAAADPSIRSDWSLTRRMSVLFALTTCAVLAVYCIWSTYLVLASIREDARDFTIHELDELGLAIDTSNGSSPAIRAAVDHIARVSRHPPCAFRVREADGTLLASAGPERLLELVPERVRPGDSWRAYLFDHGVTVGAAAIRDGMHIEIVTDAADMVERMRRHVIASLFIFAFSAVLAAVAGWFTAHRGLRTLRAVVDQARDLHPAGGMRKIEVEGAPVEVREVARALEALVERIDAGLIEMRTFTASLAHELRSPLQNLIGETEVALLAVRGPDEYGRLLRSNIEDLYDLSDAVDNLVAYCRTAQPSTPDLRAERFDLAVEAQIRIERERRSAARAGVEVRMTCEGDTELDGDREACLRVLRNLVANAVVWTPEGGEIDVTIAGRPDAVVVEVLDGGPGVPDDIADRVFEPFVTSRVQQGRRGGYGLGLAICRSVVEQHGGCITFRNEPGHGARFTATFPRRAQPVAALPV